MTTPIHLNHTYYCPYEGRDIPVTECTSREDDPCYFFDPETQRCEARGLKNKIKPLMRYSRSSTRPKLPNPRRGGGKGGRPVSRILLGPSKSSGSSDTNRLSDHPRLKYDETPLVLPDMPEVEMVLPTEPARSDEISAPQSDPSPSMNQFQVINDWLPPESKVEEIPENIQFDIADERLSLEAMPDPSTIDSNNPTFSIQQDYDNPYPSLNMLLASGRDNNIPITGGQTPLSEPIASTAADISLQTAQNSTSDPLNNITQPLGLTTSLPDQNLLNHDLTVNSSINLSEPHPNPFPL